MEQQEQSHVNRSLGLRNEPETVDSASPQPSDNDNNIEIALEAQSAQFRGLVFRSKPPSAPLPHPSLVFHQFTIVLNQQAQEVTSIRDSNRIQNEESRSQLGLHRGRPASPRHRSRSPAAATRPLNYRDRSPEDVVSRHDDDGTDHHALEGGSVCDADSSDCQHRLDKLRREKNDYAVCVACWLEDLPCDHQRHCRNCRVNGKVCVYITCISGARCPLDIKCPCFHTNKAFPQDTPTRKLGSSMHLIALLDLERSFLESYDIIQMQTKLQNPNLAPQIYFRLQQDIQHILQQQGGRLRDSVVQKLFSESDKVPRMNHKILRTKARFIVELVKEKKSAYTTSLL
jgi:hypothetical protein